MTQLNIIFAGTPDFSAVALKALLGSQHKVVAVYTQLDRPAGRGRKLTPSPVKDLATLHNLPIHQPQTLRNSDEQKILADLNADIMVVVAYGLLLPLPVLNAPRLGCINIHGSLLPRWRGAAPIQRAIQAGDKETGITIMQMDEGLDTGPMLYKSTCKIESTDTSASLYERLAKIGAEALLATLTQLAEGSAKPIPQDNAAATYAHKITKEEAALDWTQPANVLDQTVRAFNPWPVAYTICETEIIRIWEATTIEQVHIKHPGEIMNVSSQGIDVATGKNILRIQKLQFPGGKILTAADVVNSNRNSMTIGKVLST